jgi:hypothetical protein
MGKRVLEKDLRVGNWTIPEGFVTDECTMAPEFSVGDACVLHDFLRRYRLVSTGDADRIFRDECRKRSNWLLANIYYYGVKILRPFFRQTFELPYEWSTYRYPQIRGQGDESSTDVQR